MSKNQVLQMLAGLDPDQALAAVAAALKRLFPVLEDEARLRFLATLVGDTGGDKVASLVHL